METPVVNSLNRTLSSNREQVGLTLTQHILQQQTNYGDARGQLSALLTQIGVAAKMIAAQVRRAGVYAPRFVCVR